MEGKTEAQRCLVTGANRGLGLELCRQLLARGDRVVAACRQPGKATALNTLAGEHPGRLHVTPLDVAEPKSHAALARELPLLTEGEPLDLLVNNAGVLRGGERYGSVQAADLETSFRTHALGPFLLVQTLTPQLADNARVANISSEIGSIGLRQEFRTPSYAIGKAAQNMATSLLAQALAPRGILVVALHPGWVRTDMGTDRAALSPQESARGLLQVIGGLQARDSGAFLDWQGQTLPW
ncbi:SDR family oxidoreductase [Pseudoxanthomonas sp. CF125]|uniref:SDR family oxidoreductase n=1 Tax=Pseudoxanthomonas sp. CF125 TaxID=1855303 RepID=UPI00088267EB|nr:SDR family oxidoreductase [Pseudoxanthomonas sp. CF125]SDR16466.1 NAD(P)-dependent dehydrogenase, short-chain alcohol dehydrogenase family [Pseudoxanthomonas sp. CF125]